jgi:hypothetical protein
MDAVRSGMAQAAVGAFDWSDITAQRSVLNMTNHVPLKRKFALQACATLGLMILQATARFSINPAMV